MLIGEVDINDHKAIFEWIAGHFTRTFNDCCSTIFTVEGNTTTPQNLVTLSRNTSASLAFTIVLRVMILKVLLLTVRLGKTEK